MGGPLGSLCCRGCCWGPVRVFPPVGGIEEVSFLHRGLAVVELGTSGLGPGEHGIY